MYAGKVKTVYDWDEERDVVVIVFTDRITAGNGESSKIIDGKGAINLKTSQLLFEFLEQDCKIPTHFISLETSSQNQNAMLAVKLKIIPLEVVVRNVCFGSFARRYKYTLKKPLPQPIVEFFVKDDVLGDPLIDRSVAVQMGYASSMSDIKLMEYYALRANAALKAYFDENGLILVDFKLEFGKDSNGKILLGDEISMDSCRVWCRESGVCYDKDRFRKPELGLDLMEGYELVYERLKNHHLHPDKLNELNIGSFVVVLAGSKSDTDVANKALLVLKDHHIPFDFRVISAHRDVKKLDSYLHTCENSTHSPKVYICIAGLSAALPGAVAARVSAPVIGVPVSGKINLDSILSIVQMPPGIPTAAVGLDNGTNASLLALRILSSY